MKKSISILTALIVLSVFAYLNDFSSFAIDEESIDPWKDPWQWLQIFRDFCDI